MPRDLEWEYWTVIEVLNDVGQEVSEYAVYYGDRKVYRITKAGRLKGLYRLYFSKNDSTVVAENIKLTVGV